MSTYYVTNSWISVIGIAFNIKFFHKWTYFMYYWTLFLANLIGVIIVPTLIRLKLHNNTRISCRPLPKFCQFWWQGKKKLLQRKWTFNGWLIFVIIWLVETKWFIGDRRIYLLAFRLHMSKRRNVPYWSS